LPPTSSEAASASATSASVIAERGRNLKLGLRVEFDHAKGQTQAVRVVLRNLWQDPSLVREDVSMAFFARMGIASRESFAKVYINNVYSGVYGVVENVDPVFLQRTLGNNTGFLFEYRYRFPYWATDLGDDLTAYRAIFEPEAPNKTQSDTVLYTPIRNLFREANRAVDEAWRPAVDRYVDLGLLMTHVALEIFIADNDGFLGNFGEGGMNNFYLYRSATTNQHLPIFWDKSEAFYVADYPIFLRADENVLVRSALSLPT
jgi:spore coat protein CotH